MQLLEVFKLQVLTPQIKPSSGAIVKMTYFAGINANMTLITYLLLTAYH